MVPETMVPEAVGRWCQRCGKAPETWQGARDDEAMVSEALVDWS